MQFLTKLPRGRARRRGFTLIELLVAIAILGILGTVVIREIWNYIDDAKQETAQQKVKAIADIVEMYRRKHNDIPADLHVLTQEDDANNGRVWLQEDGLVDPWGNDYELKPGGKAGDFEIICKGSNGTEDSFDAQLKLERDIGSNHSLRDAKK